MQICCKKSRDSEDLKLNAVDVTTMSSVPCDSRIKSNLNIESLFVPRTTPPKNIGYLRHLKSVNIDA